MHANCKELNSIPVINDLIAAQAHIQLVQEQDQTACVRDVFIILYYILLLMRSNDAHRGKYKIITAKNVQN